MPPLTLTARSPLPAPAYTRIAFIAGLLLLWEIGGRVGSELFPIAISVIAGVQGIRPVLLASARSMGAGPWLIFKRITLPYLVPSLFTGMRLATRATLLGVILGELYVSSGGIGHFTRMFTETFQPDKLYALIAVLALFAILINETMRGFERRLSCWR